VEEYLKVAFHSQPIRQEDGGSIHYEWVFEGDPKAGKIKGLRPEIGRALLNIMANAFEAVAHKTDGGPDFRPRVAVRTERVANGVKIYVKDNGPGISVADQGRIFDPFFTTKPPNRGTGLGLSLAHEAIVRKHKGRIELKSEVGVGTEFLVYLPG
jgi:two-component system, NtrC family, sensor kinase